MRREKERGDEPERDEDIKMSACHIKIFGQRVKFVSRNTSKISFKFSSLYSETLSS